MPKHKNDPMTDVILGTVAEVTAPLHLRIAELERENASLRAEVNLAESAKTIAQKERDDAFAFVRAKVEDQLFKFDELTRENAALAHQLELARNTIHHGML